MTRLGGNAAGGPSRGTPQVSIVVAVFNMQREAERTLYSLSPEYQTGVGASDYEVIVVDNGSTPPFSMPSAPTRGQNLQYHYIDDAARSPAAALNFGVRQGRGQYVATIIDGARLLSPGVLQYALRAFDAFRNPIVTVPAWHLGPDVQRRAIKQGYGQAAEDALLERIAWRDNGYRLFEVSTLGGSSRDGWFRPMSESSCLFVTRNDYDAVGGYDERFRAPGGGLVAHDLYRRLCSMDGRELVVLLGEGTFHQWHGGVATGATEEEEFARLYREWSEEYRQLRGEAYVPPRKTAHLLGHAPREAHAFLRLSAERLASAGSGDSAGGPGNGGDA